MGRFRNAVASSRRWIVRGDLAVLVAFLGIAIAGLAFLLIADDVTDGEHGHIDVWLLRSLRDPQDPSDPLGPRWLEEAARDVTSLGGYPVLILLVVSILGYLVISRQFMTAIAILSATGGGMLLSTILKSIFVRPRPDVVSHLTYVTTPSFPSGHAMLSAVVYLTLGTMLARLADGWWTKLYLVTAAVILTFLVGVSRVYLGVHYPTDVVAGWSAGLSWAVLCWMVTRYIQRRGGLNGEEG